MANKKISELSSRTPALSDLMIVGDPSSGYSYKCTITALATIIETDIADGYVTIGTTQTISGAKTFSNNLTLTSVANAATTQTKFLTLNGSNVVNYRTGAEVLSDIGGQASLSGTGLVKSTSGTISYITDNSSNWNTAYNDSIVSAAVSGTTTKTLTLTQQDGGTLTASWSDLNTDAVTSVFGRTGAVVATEGDYSLNLLSDVTLTSPSNGQVLKYNGTAWVNDTDANTGTVTSVGLSSATSGVTIGSTPITTSGTITLAIATASGSQQGLLSSTDWTTFNNKQNTITLTTTGTSGAATLVGSTLNIPQYQAALTNPVTGTGTTNYLPKFTSSSAIGNSTLFDNGSNIGLGTASPSASYRVTISGSTYQVGTNSKIYIDNGGVGGASAILGALGTSYGYLNTDGGFPFVFQTNNTERMRLDASGNLLLGTTSGSSKMTIATADATSTTRNALSITDESQASLLISLANERVNIVAGGNDALVFGTNSTERARIDASGNLGLGTSSPSFKLDVNSGASNAYARIQTTGSVNWATLLLQNGDGTWYNTNNSDGNFNIGTGADPSDNIKLTLTASGNLGLGVTPSAWSVGKAFELGSLGNSLWGVGGGDIILGSNFYYNADFKYASSNYATAYRQQDGVHKWLISSSGTANATISFTQAMTLFSTGNLAVGGTSDNGSRLQVTGAATFSSSVTAGGDVTLSGNESYLYFTSTYSVGSNTRAKIRTVGAGGGSGYGGDLRFSTRNSSNIWNEDAMTINSSGNVGIGTTSPDARLTVIDEVRVKTAATSGVGLSKDGSGAYLYNIDNTFMAFGTNNTERMRITSGGELLINTTSDAGDYKLQVNGNVYQTGLLRLETGATDGQIVFRNNASGNARSFNYNVADASFSLNTTAGVQAAIFANNGNLTTTGSIQTAAPSGGTAKPWKLGEAGVTLGGSNTSGVRVEIDGVVYYLVTGYLP